MALDPRIALMGRAPVLPDAVIRRAQRAAAQQTELENAALQQQADDEAQIDQIMRETGGDLSPAAVAQAYGQSWKIGSALDKRKSDRDKVAAEIAATNALQADRQASTLRTQQTMGHEATMNPSLEQKAKNDAAIAAGLAGTGPRTAAQQAEIDLKQAQAKKAAAKSEFDRYYAGWLESKGLAPTAANEYAAMGEFQRMMKPQSQSKPASVAEYEYAVAHGYKGSYEDYQNADANRKRPNVTVSTGGNEGGKLLTPTEAATLGVPYGTTRAEAAGKTPWKPATAAQGTIAGYAARIKNAGRDLDRLVGELGNGARAWNAVTPEFLNTASGKSFDRAQRDIINAILRRESGAAINESEFENARKQYIPSFNDTPERIAEKKRNRDIVLGNFIKAAGSAYEDPDELVKRANGATGQPPKDPLEIR